MPGEILEEDRMEKNPDFQIAQWKFLLQTEDFKNDKATMTSLLEAIKSNGKGTFPFEISSWLTPYLYRYGSVLRSNLHRTQLEEGR